MCYVISKIKRYNPKNRLKHESEFAKPWNEFDILNIKDKKTVFSDESKFNLFGDDGAVEVKTSQERKAW